MFYSFIQNSRRPYSFAFFLGIAMTLAMPPIGAFPLLLICVPLFLLLTRKAETRLKSFLIGWAFGAGYFIAGLYWISAALFVDIARWKFILPLSLIVGPGLFGLYYGFIPFFAWHWRQHEVKHTLAIITFWALIEWIRGHFMTGFPWNLIGYTWTHVLPIMQVSAYVGIYGLTFLTLLWATIPALTHNKKLMWCTALTFVATLCLGSFRLYAHPISLTEFKVRIVQPNIEQIQKWDPSILYQHFKKLIKLSHTSPSKSANALIWPETAVSVDLGKEPGMRQDIATALSKTSLAIVGAIRTDPTHNLFYNSVRVLNTAGDIVQDYDKSHLVPFGEYIPFRDILNLTPIATSIANLGDFGRGTGPLTLKYQTFPSFSALICYEVIFPSATIDPKNRPRWIVNVTNDAWYGRTSGPHQHLESARVRAIEEGLPVARAANTGISAIIDPLGRIIIQKALNTEGVVDAKLPSPLPPTPYGRWGDKNFFIMTLSTLIFILMRLYP